MKKEQVLQVLYELALIAGGETHVEPLITKTLQRLLYHTALPCGAYLGRTGTPNEPSPAAAEHTVVRVEQIIGGDTSLHGQLLELPNSLLHAGPVETEHGALYARLAGDAMQCTYALCLPAGKEGIFLLLGEAAPTHEVSLQHVFQPVLGNFAKVLRLCRENETSTRQLSDELEERKRLEAGLVQAKLDAEKANQAKSIFLSSMSHELRTPLNAILGFAQLLEMSDEQSMSGEQLDYLQEIVKAGHHLLTLLNEILDLARVESGRIEISIEPVRLGDLLEECLSLIGPMAAKRSLRIDWIASVTRQLFVNADRQKLKQVLLNLLSNAVKYNSDNGDIRVDCRRSEDQNRILIRVSDSGAGIPEDRRHQLFQPFQRLGAEQGNIEGTGIGLVITKRLVEAMAGEIGYEPGPDRGSTFWISLPRVEAASVATEPADTATTMLSAVPVHKSTVLYIEDNATNLLLVQSILKRIPNLRILSAAEPLAGLKLAASERPDLILLDIHLPTMDGFEVLKLLRKSELTKQTPVIAVTASAMAQDVARGKAAGFAEYVTKPINPGQFFDLVKSMLRGARAAQQ